MRGQEVICRVLWVTHACKREEWKQDQAARKVSQDTVPLKDSPGALGQNSLAELSRVGLFAGWEGRLTLDTSSTSLAEAVPVGG